MHRKAVKPPNLNPESSLRCNWFHNHHAARWSAWRFSLTGAHAQALLRDLSLWRA
jgi:hypothetical protein